MVRMLAIVGLTLLLCGLGNAISREDRFLAELAKRMNIYHKVYLNRNLVNLQFTIFDRNTDQSAKREPTIVINEEQINAVKVFMPNDLVDQDQEAIESIPIFHAFSKRQTAKVNDYNIPDNQEAVKVVIDTGRETKVEKRDPGRTSADRPVFDPFSKRKTTEIKDYNIPDVQEAVVIVIDTGRETKVDKRETESTSENMPVFDPFSKRQTSDIKDYNIPDNQEDVVIVINTRRETKVDKRQTESTSENMPVFDPFLKRQTSEIKDYNIPDIQEDVVIVMITGRETEVDKRETGSTSEDMPVFDPFSKRQTTEIKDYNTPDNEEDAVIVIDTGREMKVDMPELGSTSESKPIFDPFSKRQTAEIKDYDIPDNQEAVVIVIDTGRETKVDQQETISTSQNKPIFDPLSKRQTADIKDYNIPDKQEDVVIVIDTGRETKIVQQKSGRTSDNMPVFDPFLKRQTPDLDDYNIPDKLEDIVIVVDTGREMKDEKRETGNMFDPFLEQPTVAKDSPIVASRYIERGDKQAYTYESKILEPYSNNSKRQSFVRESLTDYYLKWPLLPKQLTNQLLHNFRPDGQKQSVAEAISNIGSTDLFMDAFWPFEYEIVEMNQRIALYGITAKLFDDKLKSRFYTSLYDTYSLPVPVAEDKVLLSFNDPNIAELLRRSKLLNGSNSYIDNREYTYSRPEKQLVTNKINAAMELIRKTSPELYRSVNKLISCIALYKSEGADRVGGSTSALPGVIYLSPVPKQYARSVPFYAEQIVHEFIHNALYLEEFVIGTYNSHVILSKAKVFSSIRGVPRNYDLSLHASYVSTGLVVFHSRAGYHARAEHYASPLARAVQGLVDTNKEHSVLTVAGEAMLQTLVDFVTLMNIGQIEL